VARVVALVPDLMFGSKLVAMLQAAGHDVELCSQEYEAWSRVDEADVLVVDLTTDDFDGVSLVDSLRADGKLHQTRTAAFYAHVDTETRARAGEVGFDLIVPRSRMAREGAELIGTLAEDGGA
jgi:DNA-binding response OmpR family regulator